MIEKAVTWFAINRKKIGYTVGALSIMSGLSLLGSSQSGNGMLQIIVGTIVVYDAWSTP
jgi:hypothetical protein